MTLSTQQARANDYMEHTENYTVYASGIDKIHFSIPVWVHGAWYEKSYSALPGSKFSYIYRDDHNNEHEVTVLNWLANVGRDNDSDNDKGTLAVKFQPEQGQLVLTCMHNSVRTSVQANGQWSDWLTVKQKPAGGYDRVTLLEFDWYPPSTLDGKEFSVKMHSEFDNFGEICDEMVYSFCSGEALVENYPISCYDHVSPDYTPTWTIDSKFSGKAQLVTPTLFEPYLYQMSEDGVAGFGYAAIPYSLADEPISYKLSNDTTVHYTKDLAGNIYLMTNDTLLSDLSAKFTVWRNKDNGTVDSIVSTKVDLKPYHRIYDFVAKEEVDSTDSYTGANLLSWSIKNPLLSDLVDGDYFEIARASDSSFADGASLAVIPLVRDSFGLYNYKDDSRDTWTGNMDSDSLSHTLLYAPTGYYTLKDNQGHDMFLVRLQIQTDKALLPSMPVYYRIRRASSAVWGWHEDFMEQRMVYQHNFLAPLSATQPEYTKDADFENNHKVNFKIVLENSEVPTVLPSKDQFDFSYTVVHSVWDSVNLPTPISDADVDPETYMTSALKASLKDSLYTELKADYEANPFGRCAWDKTANLILIRTIEETGKSTEIVIPADSIRRETEPDEKGNRDWIASFSDIADKGCMHYSYAVRIDQSHADLHVRDAQTQLAAVPLSGPDLYFDESAKIVSFTASQGDARSELKQGVLLNWRPSSSAVDEYTLCRIKAGSSDAPDTLYTGMETSFMDVTAEPTVHYEYTISSYYNCNGKSTSNSATAEGWRTPYGEISGSILMPDNSGMAGVKVTLTANGEGASGEWTQITGADGSYRFDSLEYYRIECITQPTVNVRYTSMPVPGVTDPEPYVVYRALNPDHSVLTDWTHLPKGSSSFPLGTILEVKTTEENNFHKDSVFTVTIDANYDLNGYNQYQVITETDICPKFVLQVYKSSDFNPSCHPVMTSLQLSIIPTSEYGEFSYIYTSAATATVELSMDNAAATNIDFMNTKTTRLTGRALYENTTIPVAGAMFKLNGDTIRRGGAPLTTGTDGNFELTLTKDQPYTLQIFKPGHTFAQDGFFQKEEGKDTFALEKPLDGIRFYDQTKVRLVGRVAGGIDQRDLPEAFGLGKNNLGDDLQLVLQLEGDNVAHFVHDPNDLTRDTVQQNITNLSGTTHTLFEKKRVTIQPDPMTGEYTVDLFPVKYKVAQATARGYATLFAAGAGNETFDLTNAPMTQIMDTLGKDTVYYNATYDRIYRNPVRVDLLQNMYGLERKAYGEPEMAVSGANPNEEATLALYTVDKDQSVTYTLGYPVFYDSRKYQFKAKAYEAYYYNNDPSGEEDIVPQRGGNVIIRNGLHSATEVEHYPLNEKGENSVIWLTVDDVDVEHAGTAPLRSVSIALEDEGNIVETNVFSAFVTGTVVEQNSIRASNGSIRLLDIIRDPGGAGSSAYVENGAEYTFSFAQSMVARFGIQLSPTWGNNVTQYIGVYSGAPAGGSWIGSEIQTQKAFSFDIPIAHKIDYGSSYTCKLTTNDRIETSSASNPSGVGSPADVFFGTTVSNLIGKAKTISIIDDSLYQMCQPSLNAGTMLLLAQGTDTAGKPYYLVTGQKVYVGARLENTFTYSQYYIWNTLIPRLAQERQNLLKNFASADAAQAYADATHKPTYWYYQTGAYLNDTIPLESYTMFSPNDGGTYVDEVGSLNMAITRWLEMLYLNEREKVEARTKGDKIGTFSTSYGNSFSHSDTYNYEYSYNEFPQNMVLEGDGVMAGGTALFTLIGSVFKNRLNTSAMSAFLQTYWKKGEATGVDQGDNVEVSSNNQAKKVEEIAAKVGNMEFHMGFDIIKEMNCDKRLTTTASVSKSTGFTLVADPMGDITTSVYKAEIDSTWYANSEEAMNAVVQTDNEKLLYGSYVFFTEAGATVCPHEEAESTIMYNPGTVINNNTEWVAKPELTADRYEIANVSPDKRASFRINLFNEGQMDAGYAENGQGFFLCLNGVSNPDGAKVYVNGAPLIQSIYYWIVPGTPITQTIEVERGTVDDYDLSFSLYSEYCATTSANMNIGVHFLPLSTDVSIAAPQQSWTMNTLSPHDSTGYYLPITIDGFDIHHKNFDHIEFQYKLATQSDDDWVNQCSFYANDSLYALATGNKAMIENGRITPFRFYGERDPMEQRYDLRAVSFCRYGSGYVHKASPVISGIKDTRPPRVFGEPEPANSILGVGDNLLLRFNEPIAGNYLDEDNNFRIVGVTNETGITASTALHFDGNSFAKTKVKRDLTTKSYTLDLMIHPDEPNRSEDMTLLELTGKEIGRQFILTGDNRLVVKDKTTSGVSSQTSKPIGDILGYVRVLFVYNDNEGKMHFYAGTEDVTDQNSYSGVTALFPDYNSVFNFGKGYKGNMLETRIWTKALTEEEIAATNDHYLTGYERELLAYYRMNEGKGETAEDRAHGATLYLDGCSWTMQEGFSLALDGTTQVALAKNILDRSAVYDETLSFWFKTAGNGTLFTAGRTEPTDSESGKGQRIAIESGAIVLYDADQNWTAKGSFSDNEWHHLVLTINRTYNTAALYVDGRMYVSVAANKLSGIVGAMYFGGDGFIGNIDEFAVFEQALPKSLIEESNDMAYTGDEMGLIGYLPFEEQYLNPSGVLQLRFSVNDRRQFKNPETGEIIDKVLPLIDGDVSAMGDQTNNAPVSSHGTLSKLHFDWSFNNDELMINILNQDYEVNKQSIYITVRDVEDLNGNPMASPVTWTAFVDHNSLKWSDKMLNIEAAYGLDDTDEAVTVRIINNSGKRHTYRIESLPTWLNVDKQAGAIDPLGEQTITLYYDLQMAVGAYSDVIYLTDENGLSEPLQIEYAVVAYPPYDAVDAGQYPLNMSVCGEVKLSTADGGLVYDTDDEDIVYAFYRNECVGMATITVNTVSGAAEVYLTIHGNEDMTRREVNFQLWRASNGRIFNLSTSRKIIFSHGNVCGCGDEEPVSFYTTGSETQSIELQPGWSWISTNLNLEPETARLNDVMTAAEPWSEGDLIKGPATRQFSTYSTTVGSFVGTLGGWDYQQMYMVYTKDGNIMRLSGEDIPESKMAIKLRGDGQWNSFPCLYDQVTSITEAMSDYLTNASAGDIIKSHNKFVVFTSDGRWVGDLMALRPGEGYLMRRMGLGTVTVRFFEQNKQIAPKRQLSAISNQQSAFSNPNASTNSTMIAQVQGEGLKAYIGDKLVGVATAVTIADNEVLYFLTIQSDETGEVTFRTADGTPLRSEMPICNAANNHFGSTEQPIILTPTDNRVYKLIEEDHVVIIRNNEKYDVTGKKL
jgi:hypothetical protein